MIGDRPLTRDDLPFPLDRAVTGQDLLQLFPSLLGPLWSAAANAVRGDVGVVTALLTGPRRVTVGTGGDAYNARYLASYTPAVGDTVLVLRNSQKSVVIDALA